LAFPNSHNPPQSLWRLPLPGGDYFRQTWHRSTAFKKALTEPDVPDVLE
jgi:hypothetical protein